MLIFTIYYFLVFLLPNLIEGKGSNNWYSQDYEETDDWHRVVPSKQYPTFPPQIFQNQVPPPTQVENRPPPPPPSQFTPILFPPQLPPQHTIYKFSQDGRRRSRNSKKIVSIPVGDICDITDPTYSKCSTNANCVLLEAENLYKCNCSYGYEQTSGKKCMRSWGHYCDSKDPCNHESFLSCVESRCECENSEVYQNAPDRCKSKVGGPCSTTTGPECVGNAICLSFDKYGRQSRCICKDGYVETSTGHCYPGVGMPCNGKSECNNEIPLVCKEGVCSCREAVHVYDKESNSCVGLVGAQCCTNFEGLDCPSTVINGCVSGSFCKKTSRNLPGRCACQSFNLESDERSCSPNPSFGQMVAGKVY